MEGIVRLQALQRGRAARRETAPFLRAALHNRQLELGRAALPLATRIGVVSRVETHPISEACLLLKTRALKRLGARLEFESEGARRLAQSGLAPEGSWICACRAFDVPATERWLRGEAELGFGLSHLLTAESLVLHMTPGEEGMDGSTTLLSFERQEGGHLARVTSSFTEGVPFFPESSRSLKMWVSVGAAEAEVSLPAKRLFDAFEAARKFKQERKREIAPLRRFGVSMQNTELSAHKFQVPERMRPEGVSMLVLYVCRLPRAARAARGSKKRPDGMRVLAVDMRVFLAGERGGGEECSVCLEPLAGGALAGCKHCGQRFHAACRAEWHAACGATPSCPLCRGAW